MQKKLLLFGSASMAIAVILGALGAHKLQQLSSEGLVTTEQLRSFETGVRYQIYHALALIIIASLLKQYLNRRLMKASAIAFIIGTLLFSGSIYLLATKSVLGIEGWSKVLGPITPVGGLLLITGWVLFFVAALKSTSHEEV